MRQLAYLAEFLILFGPAAIASCASILAIPLLLESSPIVLFWVPIIFGWVGLVYAIRLVMKLLNPFLKLPPKRNLLIGLGMGVAACVMVVVMFALDSSVGGVLIFSAPIVGTVHFYRAANNIPADTERV
jgi:hypothetical protein